MMKEFLFIITIWGFNGTEWVYVGNQYVNKNPLSLGQCEMLIDKANWKSWEENEYYKIQFDCVKQDSN